MTGKEEKGVFGKLSQFKKSPIVYLVSGVIKSDAKSHLKNKIETI